MSDLPIQYVEFSEGYRVGDDGSVWTCWCKGKRAVKLNSWKKMKLTINPNTGYLQVGICCLVGGKLKQRTSRVHTIVLTAFRGPRPRGMQCAHRDGDRANACLDNLRWATQKENEQDKRLHGRLREGSKHALHKLVEADIPKALAMYLTGGRQREIARQFNVNQTSLRRAIFGITWDHVLPVDEEVRQALERRRCGVLEPQESRLIRKLLSD